LELNNAARCFRGCQAAARIRPAHGPARLAIPIARGRIAVQPWVTSPDGSYCDVRVTKWTSTRFWKPAPGTVSRSRSIPTLGVWIWTGAGISVRVHDEYQSGCSFHRGDRPYPLGRRNGTKRRCTTGSRAQLSRAIRLSPIPGGTTSESEKHSKTAINVSAR
jgi:hypothetical protein